MTCSSSEPKKAGKAVRCLAAIVVLAAWSARGAAPPPPETPPPETLTPEQQLGRALFYDGALSEPAGQACVSCHDPAAGFTSPDSARNAHGAVVPGAQPGRAGNRTPPSIAYAVFTPSFQWDQDRRAYVGGLFRDGRIDGLFEQAEGPLLNPLEMNNPSLAKLCERLRAPYRARFAAIYRRKLTCRGTGAQWILEALSAYERSAEVNRFSSKFDAFLAGQTSLSAAEARGLALFRGRAGCERCHPSRPGPHGEKPLFTDFRFENVGGPRNPENPFYDQPKDINPAGRDFVDEGLGPRVKTLTELGSFKTPTLRNVAAGGEGFVRSYFHNGALKSLKEVVAFYNRRDLEPRRWRAEEQRNVERVERMGRLGLTEAEEDDLVAFLRTLDDGWHPPE